MLADQPLDQRRHRRLGQTDGSAPPRRAIGRPDRGVAGCRRRAACRCRAAGGQQQQVGSLDLGQVPLHLGDGLHRVPVDGVAVHRVVLRPGADRAQQGIQRTMQPARSSASQTGSRPAPLDSISSSASRASSGQGAGRAGACSPRLSAVTGDSTRPRWAASAPARSPISGSLGAGQSAERHLAVVDDQPVVGLDVLGPALPPDEAQHPALRHAPRAARAVRSTACPIRRAARLTSRRRSSGSA